MAAVLRTAVDGTAIIWLFLFFGLEVGNNFNKREDRSTQLFFRTMAGCFLCRVEKSYCRRLGLNLGRVIGLVPRPFCRELLQQLRQDIWFKHVQ